MLPFDLLVQLQALSDILEGVLLGDFKDLLLYIGSFAGDDDAEVGQLGFRHLVFVQRSFFELFGKILCFEKRLPEVVVCCFLGLLGILFFEFLDVVLYLEGLYSLLIVSKSLNNSGPQPRRLLRLPASLLRSLGLLRFVKLLQYLRDIL